MLSILAALWGSKPLRWAASAFIALAAYNGWKYHQRSIGGEQVITKSAKAGKVNNAKAAKSHTDAQRPGSADRVRRLYCRDCD